MDYSHEFNCISLCSNLQVIYLSALLYVELLHCVHVLLGLLYTDFFHILIIRIQGMPLTYPFLCVTFINTCYSHYFTFTNFWQIYPCPVHEDFLGFSILMSVK